MADFDVILDSNAVDVTVDPAALDVVVDPNAVDLEVDPPAIQLEVDPLKVCLCLGAPGTSTLLTAVNLLRGDLVTVNTSGQLVLASAVYSSGRYDVIGASLGNYTAGNPATINVGVIRRAPMRFAVAPPIGTIGNNVFLSATAGHAQLGPPLPGGNVAVLLGTLADADGVSTTVDVWFRPQIIGRI